MFKRIFIFALLALVQTSSSDVEECAAYNDDVGHCIINNECPFINQNVELRFKSLCMYDVIYPGLCCPPSMIVRNETMGKAAQNGATGSFDDGDSNDIISPSQDASYITHCLIKNQTQGVCIQPDYCEVLLSNYNETKGCTQGDGLHSICCPLILVDKSILNFVEKSKSTNAKTSKKILAFLQQWFLNKELVQKRLNSTVVYNSLKNIPVDNSTYSKECGKGGISPRIIGGIESQPDQWPWMAAIFLEKRGMKHFCCGGSIINKRYILTAAHCLSDAGGNIFDVRQISVYLGHHYLYKKNINPPIHFGVEETTIHQHFRFTGFYNDIALIKLSRDVVFSERIRPICLPDIALKKMRLSGLVGTIAGWGTEEFRELGKGILNYVPIPIWENAVCNIVYSQRITAGFLCAGSENKDSCQGDSGGPLMLRNENNRWVLIGLVSFGSICGSGTMPGVYTRVPQYIDWIHEHI